MSRYRWFRRLTTRESRVDPETLRRAVHGDIEAFVSILPATHDALTTAAREAGPLVVAANDVADVLDELRGGLITSKAAKSWASFVREGFIRGSRDPIMALDIDYDAPHELAIANAIGRMDELGDMIDGTIEPEELSLLIESLR